MTLRGGCGRGGGLRTVPLRVAVDRIGAWGMGKGAVVDRRVVDVVLPNGAVALVRAVDVEGVGATKAGVADRFDLDEVARVLEGLSEAVKSAGGARHGEGGVGHRVGGEVGEVDRLS